ncbi:MAG TPA: 2-C-methyl-D-erythritol 4-phosphate cytidylyltransferase [candidate division WOR-3 bacterium]|uniref:2-C-methyl-D-erythritol 4-phosphate cytidylyltransferase n=1 Tax=candidate division WOR-3 bacterium TaxID=2052148 RepID=A0A7V0T4T4_UNCW3|nr:2-C-methyl-D-erythritol 4-phosphate cytidylyltransferase [candidate division WOR-3 bacterium]
MPARDWGIILAAGRGTRFGRPKQFRRVNGRPLLWYSLRAFNQCPAVSGWTVVTLPERVAAVRRLCRTSGIHRLVAVIAGGETRRESVARGLATLPERGRVAVHDAARPLLTPAMLAAGFAAAGRLPAAYAAPVTDTLKRANGGRIIGTVDRTGLWAVQTPQFFPLPLLRRAHAAGAEATDDCRLVELLGIRPRLIPAPGPNIKVTFPADIALVKALL